MPRRQDATASRSAWGSVPSRCASPASTVAIFAGRTIDGGGGPAARRSDMPTSSGQPRFSALVIMTSHNEPVVGLDLSGDNDERRTALSNRPVRIRKRDLDAIPYLKDHHRPPVGPGGPLMESGERIVDRFPPRLRQDHLVALDPISQLITLAHTQRSSDRLRKSSFGPCW